MTNKVFEIGDLVKRKPEYCLDDFENKESVVFEVTAVREGVEIKIRNVEDVKPFHDLYFLSNRFVLVGQNIKAIIDLKKLSHEQLMDLESSIEDEWERRSELKKC